MFYLQGRPEVQSLGSYGRGAAPLLARNPKPPLSPLRQLKTVLCCGREHQTGPLHPWSSSKAARRLLKGGCRGGLARLRHLSAMSGGPPPCWTMWRPQQQSSRGASLLRQGSVGMALEPKMEQEFLPAQHQCLVSRPHHDAAVQT